MFLNFSLSEFQVKNNRIKLSLDKKRELHNYWKNLHNSHILLCRNIWELYGCGGLPTWDKWGKNLSSDNAGAAT
jgi:hypothetical protein